MAVTRQAHVMDEQTGYRPYWGRVLRALRQAAGLTLANWVVELQETPPEWAEFLDSGAEGAADPDWAPRAEAMRREAGIEGARQLRLLKAPIACSVDTVQRWESGRLAPDAAAQEAIIVTCLVRDLFGTFQQEPFRGEAITPSVLRRLLAEARLGPVPGNLPARPEPIIGRERELTEIGQRLAGARLLTLVGPGGGGKTHLGLHAAAGRRGRHADGIWLVELAPLGQPWLLPRMVARALGVCEEPARPAVETLVDALRHKQLLLVLDNCEHLAGACARLVDQLLRACPGVTVLATSRSPLTVADEQLYRVPPMALPPVARRPAAGGGQSRGDAALTPAALLAYDAVRLFTERAGVAAPGFALTEENADAVIALCRRLDGMPLAIELAAAWAAALTPDEIGVRLSRRIERPAPADDATPARHVSLQTAMDWSYALLAPAEQALFRRLAVFAGGWTLAMAEAVCEERGQGMEDSPRSSSFPVPPVLDLLARLVQASLVQVEHGDGETRYRLLEPVRQYARAMLDGSGEAATLEQRHAAACVALVERLEEGLVGPDQAARLAQLEREHDNLRAALAWATALGAARSRRELGLRLAGAAWRLWPARGYFREGRRWLETLLAGEVTPTIRAKGLLAAGAIAWYGGDLVGARTHWSECLSIRRRLGDAHGVAHALSNLGHVARKQGDDAIAQECFDEGLTLSRSVGDERIAGLCLMGLGSLALARGDHAAARALHGEVLALVRRTKNTMGTITTLNDLGQVARAQGDTVAALAYHSESLSLQRELIDLWNAVTSLTGLAIATAGRHAGAQAEGQLWRATRLFGAAEGLGERIGMVLAPAEQAERDRSIATVRDALGDGAFERAWDEGRAMALEEVLAYALAAEHSP